MIYHPEPDRKNSMETYAYDTVADSLDEQIDSLSASDLLRLAVACTAAALDGRSAAVGSLIVSATSSTLREQVNADAPTVLDLLRALADDSERVR